MRSGAHLRSGGTDSDQRTTSSTSPKWLQAQNNYEIYGAMVRWEFLDVDLVDDMMSESILMYWEASKPIIYSMREKKGILSFRSTSNTGLGG